MRIADVFVAIRGDTTDFDKSIAGMQNSMGNISKNLTSAGRSLTMSLTLPIVGAGAAVTKLAMDFDTTMNQVVGLAGVSRGAIEGISEEILALGAEVGKSPQELAEAFYFVASAGFEAEEAMEVLNTAARASAAGLGETQDVAKVLGGIVNSYGKENMTAAHAADVLTEAVAQGTAEASNFASVLPQVVPAAALLGVEIEEVAGAIAAMTVSGQSASQAAVGLNQVFINLLKPSSQANDTLAAFGLTAQGLRDQLENEGVISVLRTLESTFGDNEEAMTKVFGNARSMRAAFSLLGLDAEQLDSIMSQVADSEGRLGVAFEETEGPARDLARSMAELEAVGIELGRDVIPIVVDGAKGLAGAARSLSTWWRSLSDETKASIVQWIGFAAVVGPALLVLGKLVAVAKAAVGGFKLLVHGVKLFRLAWLNIPTLLGFVDLALAKVTARLPLLGAALKTLLGPIGLVILGAEGLKFALNILTGGELDRGNRFFQLAQDTGDLGAALREVDAAAREAGASATDFRDRMLEAIDKGHTWDEALLLAAQSFEELPRAADRSLLVYEGVIADHMLAAKGIVVDETAAAVDGATSALEDGAAPLGVAADAMTEEMIEAAKAAREAVIDDVKGMLDGMTNLFESETELTDAWQTLIDRFNDPYTEAERAADIFSQNTIDNIRAAIQSGDPAATADARDLVNNMLSQFALMEPGALENGTAVPPALRAGMDSQMAALITYIENQTGEVVGAMSMEEAEEVGLEGIWLYAQGMKKREAMALNVAAIIASRAVNNLDVDAGAGGESIINSWTAGMKRAWLNQLPEVWGFANAVRAALGGSLPTAGPLKGGVASGGFSTLDSWFGGAFKAIREGMGTLTTMLGGIGSAVTVGAPAMTGLSAMTPAAPLRLTPDSVGAPMGGIHVHLDMLVPPDTPIARQRVAQAVGTAVDQHFVRTGRFARRSQL